LGWRRTAASDSFGNHIALECRRRGIGFSKAFGRREGISWRAILWCPRWANR
jgi:hypothetical protein